MKFYIYMKIYFHIYIYMKYMKFIYIYKIYGNIFFHIFLQRKTHENYFYRNNFCGEIIFFQGKRTKMILQK